MFSFLKCYINIKCQSIKQHFILYTIKIVYCQGDMFRPSLGHLQVLWENRSKSYLYFNALWDPTFFARHCLLKYMLSQNFRILGFHNALKYR